MMLDANQYNLILIMYNANTENEQVKILAKL